MKGEDEETPLWAKGAEPPPPIKYPELTHWAQSAPDPTATSDLGPTYPAFHLCWVGGGLNALGGAFWIWWSAGSVTFFGLHGPSLVLLGVTGIGVGVGIACSGLLMLLRPETHRRLGRLVLVLAAASFFTSAFGGLGVGLLFSALGGVSAVRAQTRSNSAASAGVGRALRSQR